MEERVEVLAFFHIFIYRNYPTQRTEIMNVPTVITQGYSQNGVWSENRYSQSIAV